MTRLFEEVLDWGTPGWLTQVQHRWDRPPPPVDRRVAVPVWRDPWMVVGRDTFTGDLLRRLGLANVFATASDRYPTLSTSDIVGAGPDVVLLPDEPYVFTPEDGPEAFTRTPTALVSGRLITWYGPSLLAAGQEGAVLGT